MKHFNRDQLLFTLALAGIILALIVYRALQTH
jgi:hypothetical protein